RARNRRFKQKKSRGAFQTLGRVTSLEKQPRGALLQGERGSVEIVFLSPEIARVRMRPDADFHPPFSYAVDRVDWPQPAIQVHDQAEAVIIQTDHLVCRAQKQNFHLVFQTSDGRVISEDTGGLSWRGDDVRWTRHLPAQEACYGLGQRASALNLRGKRLVLWNADPLPFDRDADPIYYSVPFYLGVQGDLAFGVLWDNPARGSVDLGATKPDEMTFAAESGELRFYLIFGPSVEAVLRNYEELTGHAPLPPIWALGFQQSRWGYDSEGVFRALAREFRARQLPCDVLYFDIDYMDGYRCFTWDRKRFPRLPGLLSDLAQQGFKAVAILDPGIKVDPNYTVYQEGLRDNLFLKYPDGKPVTAPVWPGKCHFPDFTSPRARAWWADHVAVLVQAGFAGIWNDMNEPAVISLNAGTTLPDYVRHDWDGAGQTHVEGGHNLYGMLMARATREGLQKHRPDKRPFVMTRAGHAGAQRYTSTWTGDNKSTWDHLRLSVSMVLNMGLSGLTFTGPDVGGFSGEPDGELFTRWMQLGSMLPYFRAHTMAGTAPQEPWSYGEKHEAIIRHYLELRYQLLPYLYSAFAQYSQDGTPIVRPLFMLEPDNELLRGLDDEFMLGDSILVAPVLEQGATQRQVYLPKGMWYEYDTGRLIDGGQTITADAPLERMPLYVRAGKVLPMWPVMQYVGEKPLHEARLRVYAGAGETTIYEDAGEGLAYQQGGYRWSYYTCRFVPSGQFAIQWRRAGQYQPPYEQVRVEVVGISGEPESVQLDGQAAPIWYYENGLVEFIVKPFAEALIIGQVVPPEQTLMRPPSA
ncbi:MAG: glycoside hydrolase family 31 protein, partial [Anaerolineae bacterium]|nr:glycoside hydrolase family 31 protein [Anaerolineae bacterium]